MNLQKYSERAQGFIQSAQTMAAGRGHQYLSPEHLLKVLLEDNEGLASKLIREAGGEARIALQEANSALDKTAKVEGGGGMYASQELSKVFASAEEAAEKAGDNFVTAEMLLLALSLVENTGAQKALKSAGVDAVKLNKAIGKLRKGRKATSRSAEDTRISDAIMAVDEPIRATRCKPNTGSGCQSGNLPSGK